MKNICMLDTLRTVFGVWHVDITQDVKADL